MRRRKAGKRGGSERAGTRTIGYAADDGMARGMKAPRVGLRFGAGIDPSALAPIPVCVLFVLARQLGAIADEPLWLLLGVVGIGWAASRLISKVFPEPQHVRRSRSRSRASRSSSTRSGGARCSRSASCSPWPATSTRRARASAKPAIVFSMLGIALGECAVALGLVKSLIPEPQGHGLAVPRGRGRVLRDLDAHVHAARRRRSSRPTCAAARSGSARSCSTRPT